MATLTNMEFYIIQPAEATNDVTNPSFETNTTGYTASGAGVSIARSSTYQRRGLYSLEVTTASGVESGVYFGTVNEASGVARTFSADVYNTAAGQNMRIQIRDTAGTVLTQTTFTSNGYWQRVKVTRTGTANTTRRLYVVRDSVASTAKFYVDGWYYSTVDGTYLDGDMRGFTRAVDYRWNGTPHASRSWRSGQTRSGGTLLRIKDYARIVTVLGLGMAGVTNIAQPTALDFSSYQTTHTNDREFILNLAIEGANPGELQDKRDALIDAVRPDRTAVKQPLVIRYQGLDASGNDASEPVDIVAHYVDGLNNTPSTPVVQSAPMRFQMFMPYLQKAGDSGLGLGYQTSVSNFANIGYRDTDGQWKAMGTGCDGVVRSIVVGLDGSIYAAGDFTLAGGVANTDGVAKWDGSAWSALGSGVSGGTNSVSALIIGPDGSLYAGGSFTQIGGVANTAYIAKWNGSTWSALGTGMDGAVYALKFDASGNLYAGGAFTTAGGVAASRIAKWDGSAWSALGTGANGNSVFAIAFGPDGYLYAGGSFTQMGGVADTAHIARWTGSAWSSIGTSNGTAVLALAVGNTGDVYAGGNFTLIGGVLANQVAKYNGSSWSPLGLGTNGVVDTLLPVGGNIIAGGTFTTAGENEMPDRGAVWNGSLWTPLDVNVQDVSAYFYAFASDRAGRLYLGGVWAGTTALSATVNVFITGNVNPGHPIVTFTGPGRVWQLKNYTTGKTVYFNNLTLLAGEVATLDLRRPGYYSFTSSFRGDLMKYILNGSKLDLQLQRGDNNVSSYMTGTTAASGIVMTWQDLYWSIDGAKR